jgi:starch-binding outer membrane protein, SusD/RagB family
MKKLWLILLTVLTVGGCDMLKLEEVSEDHLVPGQYLKGDNATISATNAIYAALTRTGYYQEDFFGMVDVGSDDAFADKKASYLPLDNFTYDATSREVERVWMFGYYGINRANVVLDNLAAAEISSEELSKRIRGEALFLRSVFYFNLIHLFGDAPLKLNSTETASNYFPKNTKAEIYEQIIKDLTEAEQLLPIGYTNANDIWRATSGSASALLAKTYLFKKDYALAAAKALQIINSQKYALFPTVAEMIDVAKENGIEHIFSVQGNGGGYDSYMDMGERFLPTDYATYAATSWIRPELDFYESFHPNDQRKTTFFLTEYKAKNGKTKVYPTDFDKPLPYTIAVPYIAKYKSQRDNNLPLLRYAEILLIYAEASNEAQGVTTQAVEAVNQVRRRAFGLNINTASEYDLSGEMSQETFRQAIRQERRWELCFEGKRRMDLVRWGILAEATHAQDDALGRPRKDVKEYMDLYPIPQREIELNPAIKYEGQNPGY